MLFDILLLLFFIYIYFLFYSEGDKGPTWFFIVRVTSKPPCAVIHIAFLGGTPGNLRHQVFIILII